LVKCLANGNCDDYRTLAEGVYGADSEYIDKFLEARQAEFDANPINALTKLNHVYRGKDWKSLYMDDGSGIASWHMEELNERFELDDKFLLGEYYFQTNDNFLLENSPGVANLAYMGLLDGPRVKYEDENGEIAVNEDYNPCKVDLNFAQKKDKPPYTLDICKANIKTLGDLDKAEKTFLSFIKKQLTAIAREIKAIPGPSPFGAFDPVVKEIDDKNLETLKEWEELQDKLERIMAAFNTSTPEELNKLDPEIREIIKHYKPKILQNLKQSKVVVQKMNVGLDDLSNIQADLDFKGLDDAAIDTALNGLVVDITQKAYGIINTLSKASGCNQKQPSDPKKCDLIRAFSPSNGSGLIGFFNNGINNLSLSRQKKLETIQKVKEVLSNLLNVSFYDFNDTTLINFLESEHGKLLRKNSNNKKLYINNDATENRKLLCGDSGNQSIEKMVEYLDERITDIVKKTQNDPNATQVELERVLEIKRNFYGYTTGVINQSMRNELSALSKDISLAHDTSGTPATDLLFSSTNLDNNVFKRLADKDQEVLVPSQYMGVTVQNLPYDHNAFLGDARLRSDKVMGNLMAKFQEFKELNSITKEQFDTAKKAIEKFQTGFGSILQELENESKKSKEDRTIDYRGFKPEDTDEIKELSAEYRLKVLYEDLYGTFLSKEMNRGNSSSSFLTNIAEQALYVTEMGAGKEVYLPKSGSFPTVDKLRVIRTKEGLLSGIIEYVDGVSAKYGDEADNSSGVDSEARHMMNLNSQVEWYEATKDALAQKAYNPAAYFTLDNAYQDRLLDLNNVIVNPIKTIVDPNDSTKTIIDPNSITNDQMFQQFGQFLGIGVNAEDTDDITKEANRIINENFAQELKKFLNAKANEKRNAIVTAKGEYLAGNNQELKYGQELGKSIEAAVGEEETKKMLESKLKVVDTIIEDYINNSNPDFKYTKVLQNGIISILKKDPELANSKKILADLLNDKARKMDDATKASIIAEAQKGLAALDQDVKDKIRAEVEASAFTTHLGQANKTKEVNGIFTPIDNFTEEEKTELEEILLRGMGHSNEGISDMSQPQREKELNKVMHESNRLFLTEKISNLLPAVLFGASANADDGFKLVHHNHQSYSMDLGALPGSKLNLYAAPTGGNIKDWSLSMRMDKRGGGIRAGTYSKFEDVAEPENIIQEQIEQNIQDPYLPEENEDKSLYISRLENVLNISSPGGNSNLKASVMYVHSELEKEELEGSYSLDKIPAKTYDDNSYDENAKLYKEGVLLAGSTQEVQALVSKTGDIFVLSKDDKNRDYYTFNSSKGTFRHNLGEGTISKVSKDGRVLLDTPDKRSFTQTDNPDTFIQTDPRGRILYTRNDRGDDRQFVEIKDQKEGVVLVAHTYYRVDPVTGERILEIPSTNDPNVDLFYRPREDEKTNKGYENIEQYMPDGRSIVIYKDPADGSILKFAVAYNKQNQATLELLDEDNNKAVVPKGEKYTYTYKPGTKPKKRVLKRIDGKVVREIATEDNNLNKYFIDDAGVLHYLHKSAKVDDKGQPIKNEKGDPVYQYDIAPVLDSNKKGVKDKNYERFEHTPPKPVVNPPKEHKLSSDTSTNLRQLTTDKGEIVNINNYSLNDDGKIDLQTVNNNQVIKNSNYMERWSERFKRDAMGNLIETNQYGLAKRVHGGTIPQNILTEAQENEFLEIFYNKDTWPDEQTYRADVKNISKKVKKIRERAEARGNYISDTEAMALAIWTCSLYPEINARMYRPVTQQSNMDKLMSTTQILIPRAVKKVGGYKHMTDMKKQFIERPKKGEETLYHPYIPNSLNDVGLKRGIQLVPDLANFLAPFRDFAKKYEESEQGTKNKREIFREPTTFATTSATHRFVDTGLIVYNVHNPVADGTGHGAPVDFFKPKNQECEVLYPPMSPFIKSKEHAIIEIATENINFTLPENTIIKDLLAKTGALNPTEENDSSIYYDTKTGEINDGKSLLNVLITIDNRIFDLSSKENITQEEKNELDTLKPFLRTTIDGLQKRRKSGSLNPLIQINLQEYREPKNYENQESN